MIGLQYLTEQTITALRKVADEEEKTVDEELERGVEDELPDTGEEVVEDADTEEMVIVPEDILKQKSPEDVLLALCQGSAQLCKVSTDQGMYASLH